MGVTFGDRRWLRRLGWATLAGNIGIVLTGGAVRLTASGLGCPTWPRCTDTSFTPHGALDYHSAIEFGNRTLTFVLTAIAVATFVTAWQSRRRDLRVLAFWLALGIPAQAIVGGITVLTDLNPWVVSFHLLVSLAMISLTVLYLRRIDRPATNAPAGRFTPLAWTTYAVGWVVLYLGTVVTGSGPHAGDKDVPRNGLDPLQLSQTHADAVFLFVGLSIGLLLALRATRAPAGARARRHRPGGRRAEPGTDRLRAVLQRPADRARRAPPARRRAADRHDDLGAARGAGVPHRHLTGPAMAHLTARIGTERPVVPTTRPSLDRLLNRRRGAP